MNELNSARLQLKESKKRADEDVIQQYEEQRKRAAKDLENVQQQLADAELAQKKAENSKKKLQQEVILFLLRDNYGCTLIYRKLNVPQSYNFFLIYHFLN